MFIFFVISNFVFLNLFIALLLENFEYIWEGEYAIEEVHPLRLGRIVALHHRSSTLYHTHLHIRRLCC